MKSLGETVDKAVEQYKKSNSELLEPSDVLPVVHVTYIGECALYKPVPGIETIEHFGDPSNVCY
jgi:hypothetical protein